MNLSSLFATCFPPPRLCEDNMALSYRINVNFATDRTGDEEPSAFAESSPILFHFLNWQ